MMAKIIGSRVIRYYDQPATPLKHVLESAEKTPQIKVFQAMAKNTDPFELPRQNSQPRKPSENLTGARIRWVM
jgi:hypothetical protein